MSADTLFICYFCRVFVTDFFLFDSGHPLAFFPMEKEMADIIDHDIDEEKINELSNESALPKCEVCMCIVTD